MSTASTAKKKPAAKKAAKQAELPLKARRLEDLAVGRKGCFCLTPTLLSVEEGFNGRRDYGNLPSLAADIEANGLLQPLKIQKIEGTETIYVRDGHRRFRAITEILIPQGRWPADPKDPTGKTPAPVDCVAVERNSSGVDLLFLQLSMNSGKGLTLLEKFDLYTRIMKEDPSVTAAEIARRTGETKQAVGDALKLSEATAPLIMAIEKGELAATTANLIIKFSTTPAGQLEILQKARAAAAASGRENIMPKDVPVPPDPVDSLKWTYKTDPSKGVAILHAPGRMAETRPHVIRLRGADPSACEFGWTANPDGVIDWTCGAILKPDGNPDGHFQHGMHEDLPTALRCGIKAVAKAFRWNAEQVEKLAVKALDAIPAPDPAAGYSWEVATDAVEWVIGKSDSGQALVATHGAILRGIPNPAPGVGEFRHFAFCWMPCQAGFRLGLIIKAPGSGEIEIIRAPKDTAPSHLFTSLAPLLLSVMDRAAKAFSWSPELKDSIWKKLLAAIPQSAYINPCAKPAETASGTTETAADPAEPAALDTAFQLYQIPDAPADPDTAGNYHETDRLVLETRPPGIGRLHLLLAGTAAGTAYGFRVDDASGPVAVCMPREDHRTTGSEVVTGLFAMLSEACSSITLEPGVSDQLAASLKDAVTRYYTPPEGVEPEEPSTLAFVAIPEPSAADKGAIERIKSAGSTNRDGSGVSLGNDGRFKDIESQAKKLDKILEELGDKGDEARLATANLIYNFLMAESSPTAVKNHLLGKA